MERDARYDNLKLFLIYCVILGHLGNRYASKSDTVAALQLWVYLFHMPAFIYIAGLFSKRTVNEARWDKAVSYLILYFFMKSIPVIKGLIFGNIGSVSVNLINVTSVAWFALAMFEWYIIAILIRRVHPAYVLTLSICFSIVSGYFSQIGSFMTLKRAIVFFPIFYLGYLTDQKKLTVWAEKPEIRIIAAAILVLSFVICFWKLDLLSHWRLLFRAKADYSAIKTSLSIRSGWLWRITFYVVSMLLTGSLIAISPSRKFFFSSLGAKTLPVYVFHQHLISLILKISVFKNLMKNPYLGIKCLLFAALILLLSSLPIFDIPLRYLMNIPARKTTKAES